MERRKRHAVAAPDSLHSRAKRGAAAVLAGKSLRDATLELGVPKQHIHYYVKKWKGTDFANVVDLSSPSATSAGHGSSSSQGGSAGSASSAPSFSLDLPAEFDTWSTFERKKHVLKLACMLVHKEGVSVRRAAHSVNMHFAGNDLVPKVSRTGVRNYVCLKEWSPKALGRKTVLPPEFDRALIDWINARRALHFPVFKEDVLAAANLMIRSSGLGAGAEEKMLAEVNRGWYYRFLGRNASLIGTANQRPLEVDRARWSTAKNVGEWYKMVAEILVGLNLAHWNADFDPCAPIGVRASEMIIITKPDRLISFDETRVELDMTKASKERKARTIIDKTADKSTAAESLAFKGGLQGTGVGGSTASGRALPALFIFQGQSIQPRWLSQSPDCDFYDEHGKMRQCYFLCNKKGGVLDDVGVAYLRDVILPCFGDVSAENPLAIVCDGHGSHLTLPLIEFCRAHHIHVILPVPQTTHLTQGEDVSNFARFKPELRRQKTELLVQKFARGTFGFGPEDFMAVVTPAWNLAFSREVNNIGWSRTGLNPFNRCVFHKLKEHEAASERALRQAGFDYSLLHSVVPGVSSRHAVDESESDEDEEAAQAALIGKGRITSAHLYSLGPVTSDRAYSIVKARVLSKELAAAAAKEKKDARVAAAREANEQLVSIADNIVLTHKAQIRALCVKDLAALLAKHAPHEAAEHRKLKKKSEYVAAVMCIFSHLPDQLPPQVAAP